MAIMHEYPTPANPETGKRSADYVRAGALLALLAAVIFWGLSFSSTKVLLSSLRPEQVAFLRLVLAVLALGLVFGFSIRQKVEGRDLLRMAAGGATGIFLYFVFENNGLRFTNAGTASLIVAIIPGLNAIVGTVFFKERHPLVRWCGVLLSIVGVYFIISGAVGGSAAGTTAQDAMRGNLLVLLAACAWVAYTRINVPLLLKYNSLTVTFFQTVTGMALMGLLVIPVGLDLDVVLRPAVILNLAYLGLLCSAAAYFLYLYGLKILGSTTATTFINLVPVFGVLGGTLLLQEVLTGIQLVGALIVILGIMLVTTTGREKKSISMPAPADR